MIDGLDLHHALGDAFVVRLDVMHELGLGRAGAADEDLVRRARRRRDVVVEGVVAVSVARADRAGLVVLVALAGALHRRAHIIVRADRIDMGLGVIQPDGGVIGHGASFLTSACE